MGTIYSRQDLDISDPYGPMSGRNLVSIVDDLGEQLSEADTYLAPGASGSPGHRHPPLEPPTYHQPRPGLHHRPVSFCDLHCQGKQEPGRRGREAGVA